MKTEPRITIENRESSRAEPTKKFEKIEPNRTA